jgi:glycine oxidase
MSSVVVVGAGIIGVSIADALARRGSDVTVLDMRSAGRGASRASAGILAPYIEAHEHTPLLELGTRSLALFDDFVRGVEERSGRKVEYARSGTLEVALDEPDVSRLRGSKAWLDLIGVECEWLDPSRLRSEEPAVSRSAAGALFIGKHGFVGVSSLIGALVQSARLAGAVFESSIEVSQVESSPNHVEVRAGDRRYRADHLVLAAGSWSKRVRVSGAPVLPVRPVRGQLLQLAWPETPRPNRVVWGPRCYTVPWSDGALLVGATVEDVGFDESTTADGVRELTDAVSALLPGARGAAFIEARAGLRPALPDGLPAIGPLVPRVTAATGHYRNGILLAPLTAALVSGLLYDDVVDPAIQLTDPHRAFDRT